jgi:hypothetical protein
MAIPNATVKKTIRDAVKNRPPDQNMLKILREYD